jgi:hypothetical protein
MARQTTITIETTSLLVLRLRSSQQAWCPECDREQEMPTLGNGSVPEPALAALHELISRGEVHRARAPDGALLICLRSLLELAGGIKTAPQLLKQLNRIFK